MKRFASLDLLRGVAALSVAVPHFFIYYDIHRGFFETISVLGVEVFFVLSGFVLAEQILFCLKTKKAETLVVFLIRRWMRTIPPYLVALTGAAMVFKAPISVDFVLFATYTQNLFFPAVGNDFFPVAWSLSVEEWFYLLFPAFLLVWMRGKQGTSIRDIVAGAVAFAVLFLAIRTVFGSYGAWGSEVRRCVVFRLDSIAFGFLLYLAQDRFRSERGAVFGRFLIFAAVAVVAGAATYQIGAQDSRILELLFPYLAALMGMSAIVSFSGLEPILRRHQAIAAVCFFLGKISYSIYLFHILIIALVRQHSATINVSEQFAVFLVSTVLVSTVFYHLFESPILAGRPRYALQRHKDGGGQVEVSPPT